MKYKIDPGYHSLDRLEKWDESTQGIIKKRLEKEIGAKERFDFLTEKEGKKLAKLVDLLLPQPKNGFRIKIAETIDRSLSNQKSGVRFGHDPWRGDFYRKGLAELGNSISEKEIRKILEKSSNSLLGRFAMLVLADSVLVYYSHPLAWDKVGFPGPAYPEGYAHLNCEEKDEWEPKYLKE